MIPLLNNILCIICLFSILFTQRDGIKIHEIIYDRIHNDSNELNNENIYYDKENIEYSIDSLDSDMSDCDDIILFEYLEELDTEDDIEDDIKNME